MSRSRLVVTLLGSVLILALVSAFRPSDDESFLRKIAAQLTKFYTGAFPEKSYLHLDKPLYATGETIWFKAYVVDASQHRPDTLSRVVYVDLLSPTQKVVMQRVLRLTNGTAHGDFALPDTLTQGLYTVRAYTNWMRNQGPEYFFTKQIPIWLSGLGATAVPTRRLTNAKSVNPGAVAKPDVQFFPEGGNLVAGLESIVGFKATDGSGHGLDVEGFVEDEQGTKVAVFRSKRLGMGRFAFRPEAGKRYKAKASWPGGAVQEYSLPEVRPTGFVLSAGEALGYINVAIRRKSGAGVPAEQVALVAQVRGQLVYAGRGQLDDEAGFVARIPKSKFPDGVVHFTLFDGQQAAQCERLMFVQSAQNMRVTITPDKPVYATREKVDLSVEVADAQGKPVAAQLSLAVNNTQLVATNPGQADIRTHLLLTSDLKGYVEDPGYYFASFNFETSQALDNLLLTQGWRRFVWKELLADQFQPYDFALEQSLSIGGQVLRTTNKPAPATQVVLFRSKPTASILLTETGPTGRFIFGGFDGKDTARIVVSTKPGKGIRNPVIRLDGRWPAAAPLLGARALETDLQAIDYLQQSRKQQVADQQYHPDPTRRIMLGNVTVQGRKVVPPDARRIYGTPDAAIRVSQLPFATRNFSVFQMLQGRVPGVVVSGSPPFMRAEIRGATSIMGSNEPLYLLDGVTVDADAINSLTVAEVESIEVLKGPSAAIFGSRGAGGVIAVLTKRGSSDDLPRESQLAQTVTAIIPKYYQAREFYAPKYDGSAKLPRDSDFRSATLYWNPNVATDATGKARVSFYCSDAGGTFRVSVEGIAATGTPLIGHSEFKVVLSN
ncbi:TonB-dependent receptor plug domain-containing protein [Hymenobacter jejuensis]|uniref:TonB-dependent receptor plug domain-containing protein n=1 Tax=Hymenobacter jejuensis TaxID=2502781 RepID=A0A5B8A0A5_9BACT|nr:TonB-dependent receptor plug domain-containing protein [Hymenobacter jejuensis]QDA60567.1 hypothetical protein FHG12_10805 [Hymenobacter jejuensis]